MAQHIAFVAAKMIAGLKASEAARKNAESRGVRGNRALRRIGAKARQRAKAAPAFPIPNSKEAA